MPRQHSPRRGFTLIELLVVLTLLAVPVYFLAFRGCGADTGGNGTPSTPLEKAGKVVVAVAKKVIRVISMVLDAKDLAVEILAIIDGKEESLTEHITREQADALKGGGLLIIRGADGKEFVIGAGPK